MQMFASNINKFRYKELKLILPYYIVRTLEAYHSSNDIELDGFIISSIKRYLAPAGAYSYVGTLTPSRSRHEELTVKLPVLLWFKLWWLRVRYKANASQVVYEALGHSIPLLLDRLDAQEEYYIERQKGADVTYV